MIETPIPPRDGADPPAVADETTRRAVAEILNRRPTVGMAIGIVRDGRLDFFRGHGLADIPSTRPIMEDTVFRVASITKTMTAIAILQLMERGLVDLDQPATRYLRAYGLVPRNAGFREPTVRHFLTHTAGIPEVRRPVDIARPLFGELVGFGEPVPALADFYAGGLHVDADPGSRFVYTDHDFATLGQIVEDVSGQPLPDYMREKIFRPLGMTNTDLVRTERVGARLATGYDIGRRGPRVVPDYEVITVGGGGAYSTPRDMARYLAALLNGGSNSHGTVLGRDSVAMLFAPHYQPDPRIPGIGLAFTRFDLDGHPVVEHGGILPGFISQVFLAPEDRVAVMGFTNGSRRGMVWMPGEMSGLLRHVIGLPADSIRNDIPHHPEVWRDLCGWYRLSAKLTDVRTRALTFAGVEVFVRGGRLMIRWLSPIPALYRGFALNPDDESDPYVFRVDLSRFGVGTARVVFSQAPGRGTTRVHCDLMPLTLEKQSDITNPRRWVSGAVGLATITGLAIGARRLVGR